MEDVTLPSFSWRKPQQPRGQQTYSNSECQTSEVSRKDAETDCNFQQDQEVQTDELNKGNAVEKEYQISPKVLEILMNFIRDDSKINYDRLLEFHRFDKTALETVHSYHIETRNEEIITMISNSARKTLILFGGNSHETFCDHQPRAFLCSSSSFFSLPLPTCSTSGVFLNSINYALCDISGFVTICSKDQVISRTSISEAAINSLELTKHGLLAASDDGTIQLCQIQKAGIEKVKSVKLTVSDLPRKIRKASTSNKPTAVVSISASGSECCAATETGGLYHIILPNLEFKPLSNSSAHSIKSVLFISPFIAICYHSANVSLITSEKFVDQLPIIAEISVKCGPYFAFSDHHRLILWSTDTQSISIDMPFECQAISSLSSDTLQILDTSNTLISFFINNRL